MIDFFTPTRRINGSITYDGTSSDYKIKSIEIQRVGENNKFFGQSICQRLNVHVLDDKTNPLKFEAGKTITLHFTLGGEEVPQTFQTFYISEVHKDETKDELSITAYDAIKKASKLVLSDMTLSKSYDIATFVQSLAAAIGTAAVIPDTIADDFATTYPTGINAEDTDDLRKLLNAACEATQTICFINADNQLEFKRLSNDNMVNLAISKRDYFSLKTGDNRRLTKIVSATELGDNVEASTTLIGTTQYVRDNPFWDIREDIATLLNKAIANVGNFTINQFECEWRGDLTLRVGDKISLTTKDNDTVISYILDDTITYDGGLKEKSNWQYEETDETATNSVNLGDMLNQTYARVNKQDKQIDLLIHDSSTMQQAIDRTITQVNVEYYLSTSTDTPTGGTWQTTAPKWEKDKYMWSRQVITYNDGTTRTSNETCIAGAKGEDGKDGSSRGIDSITTEYY